MPRVKSAKGVVVDFDQLKIKRQLADKPVSIDVKARQAFNDQKARRRLRKVTKQATAAAISVDDQVLSNVGPTNAQPIVTQPQIEDNSKSEEKTAKQKIRPPK